MDKVKIFKESKDHLLKINKIYEQTLKTGKMSKLDFDLLIDHVRDMYECLLQFDTPTTSIQDHTDSPQLAILPQKNQASATADPHPDPILPEPVPVIPTPIAETPEPTITETFTAYTAPEEIPSTPEPILQDPEPVSALQSILQSLNDDDTTPNAHAASHSTAPVGEHIYQKDLFKMIGFNEKYIFLSELFSSNQNQYQLTMQDLNKMPTYEDCLTRIEQHWKPQLHWQTDNEGYQYLLKLIELKYL